MHENQSNASSKIEIILEIEILEIKYANNPFINKLKFILWGRFCDFRSVARSSMCRATEHKRDDWRYESHRVSITFSFAVTRIMGYGDETQKEKKCA